MNLYTVRDAEMRDIFELSDIIQRVLKESPTYTFTTFDKKKTANFLVDGVKKRDGSFLRIIVDQYDKPVGGLMGWMDVMLTGPDKVAYDLTMMIDEEHRGKCLKEFLQIVLEYKDWAINSGAKIVKLGVSSGIKIDSASRLLEKLGFERIGAMHGFIVGGAK